MIVPTSRYDFGPMLVERGLTGDACELGVAEGGFSFALLDRWPGRLYMVDPWGETKDGQERIPLEEQERRFKLVMDTALERYDGRALPWRIDSIEASKFTKPESLDFVYLDADHSYEGVAADLAAWWPKLKRGGLMAGHDYLDGVHGGVTYGVERAVDDFAAEHELGVHVIREEWPSFWMVKP